MITDTVTLRLLGVQDYQSCWQAMKQFTDSRDVDTPDEIWLLEHPPVFTQGQNGKAEHILQTSHIPIIQTDRGGQVTFHGPGQIVIYTLIDMKRKKFHVRDMVTHLEQAIIQLLASYHITAIAKKEAPGVYVEHKKIASVGLRVRRGCSYHGLALNVDMDMQPFSYINPCGFTALKMTQLIEIVNYIKPQEIGLQLIEYLSTNLGYTNRLIKTEQSYADQNINV
jgi:lipoyl(octanoyl) transferase